MLRFYHTFDNVTYKSVCINKSVNQCLEHTFFYYILFMMISLAFQMWFFCPPKGLHLNGKRTTFSFLLFFVCYFFLSFYNYNLFNSSIFLSTFSNFCFPKL